MARTLPAGIQASFYRLYGTPLQIFELYLLSPYTTPDYYFVANNADITFGGQLYTAIAIRRSAIKSEDGTVLNDIEIGLDNVDLEFKNYIASGALNRKRVICKLIFNDHLDNANNHLLLFDGYLDEPKGDDYWVTMTVRPFPMFEREYPRRIFQIGCNYLFGDASCTMNRDDYYDVVILTGAQTASRIEFDSYGKAADYWVPGYAEILTGDLAGQVRPTYSTGDASVNVRVAFDGIPSAGDTVKLQKLCKKSTTACIEEFDNYLNVGSFPHVPKKPVL
jgi:hypothetical protein